MRLRLIGCLGLVLYATTPFWGGLRSQEPVAAPKSKAVTDLARFQPRGAGSCASMSCHNADGTTGFHGREYAAALERDPAGDPRDAIKDRHAEAYAVLLRPRSKAIEQRLKGLKSPDEARPEANILCLRCHVTPGIDAATEHALPFRSEGVSCEACHGPAQQWLAAHFRPGWSELSAADKLDRGMRDTRSLAGRVRSCVDCHVGAPGMEVNHDLLAAGHPRLSFEFGSFHLLLHKHWDHAAERRRQPDFESRAWALGQVATAQAALRLLADRAADGRRPWPELAEYDCFACHHDLRKDSRPPADDPQRRLGSLPANRWYTSALPAAVEALGGDAGELAVRVEELRRALEAPRPSRDAVGVKARALVTALDAWAQRDAAPPPAGRLADRLLGKGADTATRSWDDAAQLYLALTAAGRAGRDSGSLPRVFDRPEMPELRERLQLPRDFDPSGLRKLLDKLGAK